VTGASGDAVGRQVVPSFDSLALRDIPVPDHADVMIVPLPARATTDPRVWAETVFSPVSMPRWVRGLFAVRQALVGLIGIDKGSSDVFAVAEVSGQEALIVADERHLDFRAAVAVDLMTRTVRVTTTVRLHGWRGRVYFAPVSLVHGAVTTALLRGAARRLGQGAP
jgi:hypothetical protein